MLNGRFLGLVMTFDSDWKQFSPTRLLLEDLFAWSSLHGITIFDFTIGDESYKIEYADRTLSLYQTNMHVSIIGKLYRAVKTTKSIPSILFMSAARRTIWKFRKDTGKDD
jgi:CelD/BcsL family acetyltransferase involved in cellulose biosynthesis